MLSSKVAHKQLISMPNPPVVALFVALSHNIFYTRCVQNFYNQLVQKSDCVCYRYKVEAIINAPPTVVVQYTAPGPNSLRLQWDEHVKVHNSQNLIAQI